MTRLDINLAALSEKINEQGATWTCGETSMTKLSLEEAKLRLGFVPPPGVPSLEDMVLALRSGKPQEPFIAASTVGAPSSYDLRNVSGQNYVTPIRDQGGCGSCVAFGAVAVLESTLRVALQNPTLDIDLSEAHLFYCHGRSQGRNCDNGWFPDAAFDQCSRKGLAFENSYPYTAGDQNCTGLDADWGARYVKLSGRRHLSGAAIKEWISTRGPVTGCFVVFDDFLAYRGGVYQHISGKEVGGHCVAIIGYDDSQRCWICKNSWGPNWGENGFFRIGYGECAIDTWAGPIGVEGVSILEVPSQFSLVSQTAGFGSLLDGQHPIWIADFTGVGHAQVMFYYAGDGNWWLADMVGGQLQWSLVSQTAGFGSLLDGQHPIWIADFTGVGHAQVMFYYAGDGNWWLADMVGGQLQWSLVSQTAGFGSLLDGQHPIWIADFTGVGHAQVMFYYAGDGNWWLADMVGGQLQWSLVSQTAGFGSLLDGQHPIWIADFTGVGHAQVMFYYAGDGNWWLADMVGGQLQWSLVSQTAGFGSLLDGQHPIWIADFTGVGHAQVMFYYAGDGNWWLADMVGGQLQWSLVSQTAGFGSLLDGQHPIWIADFTGVGHAQVMFYYAGDGNWWLADMVGGQLQWSLVSQTAGFGSLLDGQHPIWIADFTGVGHAQVMFYYAGDGNWWLADMVGGQLQWSLVSQSAIFGSLLDGQHPIWIADFTEVGHAQVMFYYAGDGNWWLGSF